MTLEYHNSISRVIKNREFISEEGQCTNELIDHAIRGLQFFCNEYSMFKKECKLSYQFICELEEYCLQKSSDGKITHDICFMAFEALAIIMQEKMLRDGECKFLVQKEICQYFEESGDWLPTDETLISIFYYKTLPSCFNDEPELLPSKEPAPLIE